MLKKDLQKRLEDVLNEKYTLEGEVKRLNNQVKTLKKTCYTRLLALHRAQGYIDRIDTVEGSKHALEVAKHTNIFDQIEKAEYAGKFNDAEYLRGSLARRKEDFTSMDLNYPELDDA